MIGDMKHRVTIKKLVLTPDGAGGFSESLQEIATVYAAIMPVAAAAQLKYGQIELTATHRIVIRHRADITSGMSLTDEEGVTYTIISSAAQNAAGTYLALLAAMRSS